MGIDASIISEYCPVPDFQRAAGRSGVELRVAVEVAFIFLQGLIESFDSKTAVGSFEDHAEEAHGAHDRVVRG